MKILIVDNEEGDRELLKDILQPFGLCHLAEDGLEGVELFIKALSDDAPFDFVLLDINMPNMDGQEALKRMRMEEMKVYGRSFSLTESRSRSKSNNYAIIIMQTSMQDPTQMVESFIKGKCNGYITKPVTRHDLIEKLKRFNLIDESGHPSQRRFAPILDYLDYCSRGKEP